MADRTPSVPSEKFYAIHDWDSLEVKARRQAQGLVWDPWPVKLKHTVNDDILSAAQVLVRIHNAGCITCSHQVTLLPASGNNPNQQGGSADRGLYSLRSPSELPVRIHIWRTPGAKIMASKGLQTAALTVILASFGSLKMRNIKASDICKHYRCWKSRLICKKWLESVPTQLHRTVHERWWSFNGFFFLKLPLELREMIVRMIIPRRLTYRNKRSSVLRMRLASVNKQLYNEVMTTFSLYATILFQYRFLYCPPAKILTSPLYWKHVRRIELDLGPTQLSHLFDVPRDLRVGDSAQSCLNGIGTQFQIWVNECRLQRALIRFPNVRHGWRDWQCDLTVCQKVFCLRVWAAIRVVFRDVPTVEIRGHLDEKQKQEWSKDLALERKGVAANLEELKGWQSKIWGQ
ncbi:MAG: hypothetical protein ASARMPREDX12_003911 [Alectoria sarmentosa]|nr:MAG: hypothetical protein ASARMPREDX12_003911 [Alectoria sarmentosa]